MTNNEVSGAHESRGLKRRTVVQGAAWSIPVIAAAVATPLAAASTALGLEFSAAQYSGTACTTITNAQVTATDGGVAASNTAVTVTLDSGYTFADGSNSFTGVTDGAGSLSLPAIRVPAEGGNASFLATSGAATATATATAPIIGSYGWISQNTYADAPAVPPGSVPAFGGLFLTSDNRLIGPDGTVYANNVAEVGQGYSASLSYHLPLRLTDGTFAWLNDGVYAPAPNIPAGSKLAYGGTWLTPDGRIIDAAGTVYATNVVAFGDGHDGGDSWHLGVEHADGTFGWINTGTYSASPAIPAGSSPAYGGLFLTPDDRLIDSAGTVYATNVRSVGQGYATTTTWHLALEHTDGTFGWINTGTYAAAPGIPSGSAPAFGGLWLTPDGRIISADGTPFASNVESIGDGYNVDGNWDLGIKLRPTACAW
jgi:hypothetical protein